jgi:hypothetical protein
MPFRPRDLAFVAAGAGAVAALSLAFPSPFDVVAVLPWALVVGGPAVLWLVQPRLAREERTWPRALGLALPALALAAALRESLSVFTRDVGSDLMARHVAMAAVHAAWLFATVLLAARSWRRVEARDRASAAGFGAAALVLAIVADLMPVLVVAELAALAVVARHARPFAAWRRAAVAGLVVLGAGGFGLWVAVGAPRSVGPAVDAVTSGLGIMPVLAAGALAFVAFLALPTRPAVAAA